MSLFRNRISFFFSFLSVRKYFCLFEERGRQGGVKCDSGKCLGKLYRQRKRGEREWEREAEKEKEG